MRSALVVEGLRVSIDGQEILRGVDLEVPFGEIHAIMGPNGSGKSTLSHALTGHPDYAVEGSIRLAGVELVGRDVDERSRLGLLHAFQYPTEIPGIPLGEFVREAGAARGIDGDDLERRVAAEAERFGMEPFLTRSVNDDLSGGEKKRSEIFQVAVLEPAVAILDEIDSGLDIDAVRQVAQAVEGMRRDDLAVVMITHYARILRYLTPDRIHVMLDGRIVESGGAELAEELEAGGYEAVRQRLGIPSPKRPRVQAAAELFTDTPFDV